jgi:hypothetical protein
MSEGFWRDIREYLALPLYPWGIEKYGGLWSPSTRLLPVCFDALEPAISRLLTPCSVGSLQPLA